MTLLLTLLWFVHDCVAEGRLTLSVGESTVTLEHDMADVGERPSWA